MQSVEQYAWEKAAAFREDQGKYHPVDQGEADLEHCFPQFRAASYVQNVLSPNRTEEIIIAFPTPCPSHAPQMMPRKKISSAIPIPSVKNKFAKINAAPPLEFIPAINGERAMSKSGEK